MFSKAEKGFFFFQKRDLLQGYHAAHRSLENGAGETTLKATVLTAGQNAATGTAAPTAATPGRHLTPTHHYSWMLTVLLSVLDLRSISGLCYSCSSNAWHMLFLTPSEAPLLLYFIALLLFPVSPQLHSHSLFHLSELLKCIPCICTSSTPSSICLFQHMHIHENMQCCLHLHKLYYALNILIFTFSLNIRFWRPIYVATVNLVHFFLLFMFFILWPFTVCLSSPMVMDIWVATSSSLPQTMLMPTTSTIFP